MIILQNIQEDFKLNWDDIFYYDESSPSCLRWNTNIYFSSQHGLSDVIKIHKGEVAGSHKKGKENRWAVKYNQQVYKVHRIVYELLNRELSSDPLIDHLNGDSSDNRGFNLRAVPAKVNCRNSSKLKSNKTGVTGVATCTVNGCKYYTSLWTDMLGKGRNKYFSVKKLGEELAFFAAFEYREQQINLLNLQGAGYTDRHGI